MSWKLPISAKGIILCNEQVLLLKNERNEWELPGGRLEQGETPEECVIREIREELGFSCSIASLIDAWVYEVLKNRHVFIVAYLCNCPDTRKVKLSHEHSAYQWFPVAGLEAAAIPKGYVNSIRIATNVLARDRE